MLHPVINWNTYFLSVISDLVCISLGFSFDTGMSTLAVSAVTLELLIRPTLLTLLNAKLSEEDMAGLDA